jgi:hypothetical protein
MQGDFTRRYLQIYEDRKAQLANELKNRIRKATYQTDQEVIDHFNIHVHHLFSQLFSEQVEGVKRTSWFRNRVIERYKLDQYRYQEGFQIDGFLSFILPEIQQEFKSRYEKADEQARIVRYFDKELALTPDKEEILRLLAYHDAYLDYFDNRFTLVGELKAIIEREKDLEDTNHFNKLLPIEVFNFIHQLTQHNPNNKEPFLTEKQVYDLTNMICRDQPVTHLIRINMFPDQRRFIVRFIYDFYKFCKDAVDSRGSRKKYISILTQYIAQFDAVQGSTIHEKNFAREYTDSPIKINDKYIRWKNA